MKEHSNILRAYFGMVRRWAALVKPQGQNDAQLVLDALEPYETGRSESVVGETLVESQGYPVFRIRTAQGKYGPETTATPQPFVVLASSTEGPPPPSDG